MGPVRALECYTTPRVCVYICMCTYVCMHVYTQYIYILCMYVYLHFYLYASNVIISSGNLFFKNYHANPSLDKYGCWAAAWNWVSDEIWLMWANAPEICFVSDIIPALKYNPRFLWFSYQRKDIKHLFCPFSFTARTH